MIIICSSYLAVIPLSTVYYANMNYIMMVDLLEQPNSTSIKASPNTKQSKIALHVAHWSVSRYSFSHYSNSLHFSNEIYMPFGLSVATNKQIIPRVSDEKEDKGVMLVSICYMCCLPHSPHQ